jgi:hypothetical protein
MNPYYLEVKRLIKPVPGDYILHLFFRVLYLLFFINLVHISLYSQDNYSYNPWKIDTLITADQNIIFYKLPEEHRVLEQSLQIELNHMFLSRERDYRFNSKINRIDFYIPIQKDDSLLISYQILPLLLKKRYQFFTVDTLQATEQAKDSVRVVRRTFQNPFAEYGGRLKRSGTIVRGISIGSNRDMTLNSGLNLQLSGNLTDEVEIVAALTDEATPIQPEGNTQTLQEVDKVFIEFRSPWVKGTVGDFNLQYENSQFASLSRKLQGITLSAEYKNYQLGATVGSTRGYFSSMSFLGQEGNQGPYQLTGKNGERAIIVLAGTERIWINGEKMVRGENNDYIIEYANGQVTFSNRRLITSESRLEIDFEYYPAYQQYTRNVYSGISDGNLYHKKLSYSVKYYHEEDDPRQLLEAEDELSKNELNILKTAGDDPLAAFTSGVKYTGADSGNYDIDPVYTTAADTVFIYAGENQGSYAITFSYVGEGKGDYIRDRFRIYRWVGKNQGSYLPVQLIPLPNRQQVMDIQMQYQALKTFKITSEYAISNMDANILSPYHDENNQGQAVQLGAESELTPIGFQKHSLGKFAISATGRYIDDTFQSADRFVQPDYNRYWNLFEEKEGNNEEESVEGNLLYQPWQWMNVRGNYGTLRRNVIRSYRSHAQLDWDRKYWFRGNLSQEYITSKRENMKNDWLRQKGKLEKDIYFFQPGLLIEHEERHDLRYNVKGGFEFFDYGMRLGFIKHEYLSGYLQYNERNDDIFDPEKDGQRISQAITRTRRLRFDLAEWKRTSGSLEVILRKKDYTPEFERIKIDAIKLQYVDPAVQDTVWQDRETNLAELIVNNYQWDRAFDLRWQYRISTEQLALREKIYIEVDEGRGNYRRDEDLQEYVPDPDGNYVLYILPSGQFEPITNLQTSLSLKLDPGRYWRRPKDPWQSFFKNISSETYVRIDEETKEKRLTDIYLLNISNFQGDSTMMGSIIVNEDLYFLRRSNKLSFRLRYRYRDDKFNQYLDSFDNEDKLSIERGIRADYAVHSKVKAQSEVRQRLIVRKNKADILHNRDITSNILNQNISYRPESKWEFGIESENGFEKDIAENKDLNVRYHSILLRTDYSIFKKGKISTEYEYQLVRVLNNPQNVTIPFEMAKGKKKGVNKRWQLRAEYTLATNIVFSIYYSGRDEAGLPKIIHSGQAEIRAYF